MLIIVQTNYGEFSVILRNENFRVSLCLQEVLEYLKFYETTTQIVNGRTETCTNIKQHFILFKNDCQLDELIHLVTESQAVTLILNILCQMISLIHKQFKLI